jgi:hypothetical protein
MGYPPKPMTGVATRRDYDEDMRIDPLRDGGTPDPSGGTDCAHPRIGGVDNPEAGSATCSD